MKHQKWYARHTEGQDGRLAVVTGGNSGIGFYTARGLLYLGATVVLACRNEARALAARERLCAELPNARVEIALLDLADNASIDAFAVNMQQRYEKIDYFVHCAGVYYPNVAHTAQGISMTLGVNFIGTVRLAEAMLPCMHATGRMIFTTSLVDRFGKAQPGANASEGYAAYAHSKYLLSAWVLQKAAKRGEKEPIFVAAHPGITATELLSPAKTTHKPLFSRLGHAFLYLFTHKPEKAALTSIFAAVGKVENGACIGPRGLFGISGYPHKTRFCRRVRRAADLLSKNAGKN